MEGEWLQWYVGTHYSDEAGIKKQSLWAFTKTAQFLDESSTTLFTQRDSQMFRRNNARDYGNWNIWPNVELLLQIAFDSLSKRMQTYLLSSWRQQLPELPKCSHSSWLDLSSLFVFGIDHTRGLSDGDYVSLLAQRKIFQCPFQSFLSAPGFAECTVTTEHQSSGEEASSKPLQDLSKDSKQ